MPINLLVADDHEVVRRGLDHLLRGSAIKIVAEASDSAQTLRAAKKVKPDVVLLDVRMKDVDGIATLKKLRKALPKLPVVMFSVYDNHTYIARSATGGATDYVLKSAPKSELVRAIQNAAKGNPPAKNSLLRQMQFTMADREMDPKTPLTKRELQVVRHIALGLSNKEIAQSLDISVETVKEHVQNLLRKLQFKDRTQAAVWTVKSGLI